MDLEIREFQATIEAYVSKNDLPWEIKKMCLKEILEKASIAANEAVRNQLEERSAKENEQGIQPD